MIYSPRRWLGLAGTLCLVVAAIAAEPAPPVNKGTPSREAGKTSGGNSDLWMLAPGGILIIGDDAKATVRQPGVIVLSAEKWKEIQDQLDKAKRQANGE